MTVHETVVDAPTAGFVAPLPVCELLSRRDHRDVPVTIGGAAEELLVEKTPNTRSLALVDIE